MPTFAALFFFVCVSYSTPLDDYISKIDTNYAWKDTGLRLNGSSELLKKTWEGYVLNMTSQLWLTPADSSRALWWHSVVIIVPSVVTSKDHAFVWLTGSDNEQPAPSSPDTDITIAADWAMGIECVAAVVYQIPNQHTIFALDPLHQRRSEDGILAYTWNWFLQNTSRPEVIAELPMTKAAVRGLDTVSAFMLSPPGSVTAQNITSFVVAGGSKRGWTTWLTAAVDTRVKLMVPVVLDLLHFIPNLHHQYRSYGNWSFALADYVHNNITLNLDSPNLQVLAQIIDPFYYADRLTIPKLIVNAGNDEFQQPDDSLFWWEAMPEPKHLLMVPNAPHSEITGLFELVPAVGEWVKSRIYMKAIPEISWTIENMTGTITATTNVKPKQATMWRAETCNGKRRDFRFLNLDSPCECGKVTAHNCLNLRVVWLPTLLQPTNISGDNFSFQAFQTPVADRWVAFFIDFVFDNPSPGWPIDWGKNLEFTTQVSVVPQTFPFSDCSASTCAGGLV